MKLISTQDRMRFYQGDARRLDVLADESVHMVVTSPPYWDARPEYATWASYTAYLLDMFEVWRECYRVLCDSGRIAVNVPLGYGRPGTGGYKRIGDHTANALEDAGFEIRGHVVWVKGETMGTAWGSWLSAKNPSLRDGHEIIIIAHKGSAARDHGGKSTIDEATFLAATRSVWNIPTVQSWHPAPFPSEIPRRLIQLYTFAGDTVLDPFAGSFTTVFEAAQAGRYGIGVDLNEDYVRHSAGPLFSAGPGEVLE